MPVSTSLTVRDLMQKDVVTVTRGTTVAQLMRLLSEHDISGAPVVDASGSVVGVVSASDVMRLAEWPEGDGRAPWRAGGPARPEAPDRDGVPPGYFRSPEGLVWQFPLSHLPLSKPKLETTPVEEIMTPATFHVRPDATLPELARFLVRSNVHRALVFEGSRLAGIVTTMDVMRAVAEGG